MLVPVFQVVLGSIVPYHWLLQAAFVFALVVVCILLFVVFFLYRNTKERENKKHLRSLFSDLIAEITICESEEERREALHQFLGLHAGLMEKSFPRKILIREIVKAKDSISGGAAQNLRWLFETLDLDKDTLRRFASPKWHRKASAIQHMAEMQQENCLVKIYRETNNANAFIRTEAQIAVVKLTGFKGLRFLNIVSYPVSQWQQLALINHLQEGEIEEAAIRPWLRSRNDSVVEFALRLSQIYKCFNLHDDVMACLQHTSATIRLQALQALKEIAADDTADRVMEHFAISGKHEQVVILDMLTELGIGNAEVNFLTSLLQHTDEGIRYRALYAIQQGSPAWSTMVIRQIKDNPSFTYILSTLEKRAV